MITERELIEAGFMYYEANQNDLHLTPTWLCKNVFVTRFRLNEPIGIDLTVKKLFIFNIPMPIRYTSLPFEESARITQVLKFPENIKDLLKIISFLKENFI